MPLRRLLISVSRAKAGGFIESRRDDLQSHRQVTVREAAGDGDGRKSRQVKRIGKTWPHVLLVGVHAVESVGGTCDGGGGKDIDAGEIRADLLVEYGAGALRGKIVRGA